MLQPNNVDIVYCQGITQPPSAVHITYVFEQAPRAIAQSTSDCPTRRLSCGLALYMWRAPHRGIGALKSVESLPCVPAGRNQARTSWTVRHAGPPLATARSRL